MIKFQEVITVGCKKLTRIMKIELSNKCRIKPEDYGLKKNTIDEIQIVNNATGETLSFNKADKHLKIDPYNWR